MRFLIQKVNFFGNQLKKFEDSLQKYVGVDYGIGCDNGTNAIFLALKSLDIGLGDEVITVPNTAIPTVSAICQTGATPKFVDTTSNGLMDQNILASSITNKTKAIIPVHLYGFSCQMESICNLAKLKDVSVIEDCSQAHGE